MKLASGDTPPFTFRFTAPYEHYYDWNTLAVDEIVS
jgi:hypothetical protein